MNFKFMKQISIITYHVSGTVISPGNTKINKNTFPPLKETPVYFATKTCHKMENVSGDILRRVMHNVSSRSVLTWKAILPGM